jgi:hypothetical protein
MRESLSLITVSNVSLELTPVLVPDLFSRSADLRKSFSKTRRELITLNAALTYVLACWKGDPANFLFVS